MMESHTGKEKKRKPNVQSKAPESKKESTLKIKKVEKRGKKERKKTVGKENGWENRLHLENLSLKN